MSLGKVSIAIEAQMASFESDMGRAARVAEKEFKRIEAAAKRNEAEMKAAGKAIGLAVVAGATAAAYALKQTIDRMDDLSKAAKTVGMDTEGFSRLSYAAELANVSQEELQSGLGRLVKAQAAAMDASSEQAKLFAALGISVKDAGGAMRPTRDVMLEFADAFAALKGSPEALAAGLSIFGRGFQTFVPLINEGSQAIRDAESEADKLKRTISGDAGNQAEQFNDNLTRLKAAAQGLASSVATQLLPDLVRLTENLVKLARDGDKVTDTARAIGGAIDVAGFAIGVAVTAFNRFSNGVEGATQVMIGFLTASKGVATLDFDAIRAGALISRNGAMQAAGLEDGIGNKLNAKRGPGVVFAGDGPEPAGMFRMSAGEAQARTQVEAMEKRLRDALAGGTKAAKKTGGGAKAGKSDAEREAEQLQKQYGSLIASQLERIALMGKESEVAKVSYDTQSGSLMALSQVQKDALVANAKKIDLMVQTTELEKLAKEAAEASSKAELEGIKAADEQISAMEFELSLLGKTNIERERSIALRQLDISATDEQRAAVGRLAEELVQAGEQQQIFDDLKVGLADAFVDFASGAKSAKDAFGDFADALYKRALQFVADKAINALFDAFTSGGSGGSGGGASGGGWAAAIGSLFGGGRAMGGPVSGGNFYEVGENNRPEILRSRGKSYLIPGNDGAVMPMRGGAGGMSQTNNFILQASRDTRTQEQIAAKVAFETSRVSRRNS